MTTQYKIIPITNTGLIQTNHIMTPATFADHQPEAAIELARELLKALKIPVNIDDWLFVQPDLWGKNGNQ